jgi:hypothetical protein
VRLLMTFKFVPRVKNGKVAWTASKFQRYSLMKGIALNKA